MMTKMHSGHRKTSIEQHLKENPITKSNALVASKNAQSQWNHAECNVK